MISIRALGYKTGLPPKLVSTSRACIQSSPRWGPARPRPGAPGLF